MYHQCMADKGWSAETVALSSVVLAVDWQSAKAGKALIKLQRATYDRQAEQPNTLQIGASRPSQLLTRCLP